MADKKNPFQVNDTAREIIEESRKQGNGKQFILWMAALVVSERLGHESVKTTLEIYSHLYPDKAASVAEKLEKLKM